IATPTPPPPATKPPDAAIDKPPTMASISEVSVAVIVTSPTLADPAPTTAFSIYAFVLFRMTLVTPTPAPAKLTPTNPPPIAADAATPNALIVASSVAEIVMSPPLRVCTLPLAMYALTSLLTSLVAVDMPTETATPTRPKPAPIEAVPTVASI